MLKIIMLQGLPASGKSTWAKRFVLEHPNHKRVNKDDLRAMLDAGKYSKTNEKFVLKIRDILIREALLERKSVIVDDTNFHPSHEHQVRKIAHELEQKIQHPIGFEIRIFDTPVEECIRRDMQRPHPVGERVIRSMYMQKNKRYEKDRP